MVKVYKLLAEQPDKTDRDNVEVEVTDTTEIIKAETKTIAWYKAEVARLNTKAAVVAEQIATLEAEQAVLQAEAEKYELVEEPVVEEPAEEQEIIK